MDEEIDALAEALREDYRRRGMIPNDASTFRTIPENVREHYRESARFIKRTINQEK